MISDTRNNRIKLIKPDIRKCGEKLMHHQCWLFGRDIWHPSGNLLIRYGFERFGVPKGMTGGNSYRKYLDKDTELVIWGFGIFLGEAETGGVFISRFGFSPKVLEDSRLKLPITESDQLPPIRHPLAVNEQSAAMKKARRIVEWLINYETWIERTCNSNWRRQCLADWDKSTLTQTEIVVGWKNILTDFGGTFT